MFRFFIVLSSCLLFATVISANTFYLDPNNGNIDNDGSRINPWSSLEEVFAAGFMESYAYGPLPYDAVTSGLNIKNANAPIKGGDTLVLLDGLHGEVFLRNYNNATMTTIIGEDGHRPILRSLHLQACKNWNIRNIYVSPEPYGEYFLGRLVYIESHGWQGPSSHVNIEDSVIYSSETPWDSESEWVENAASGIYITGDSCTVRNNLIRNVDHGISCIGDYIKAEENQIINFSGDGMRVLGSNILVQSNLIKNCYDVDDNHDDGIQSFTTNGYVVDNNQIIGNIILNTDDESRDLNGPLQGIGCFDGFYNNWLVANNLIYTNHYHGITFLGANDCHIINNTVLDPSLDETPGPIWIRVDDHKDGRASKGCVVKNNVTNRVIADADMSHNVFLDSYEKYEANFIDYQAFDFHLKQSSILIDAADPSSAAKTDLDGNNRFIDQRPDIGAYEYIQGANATVENPKQTVLAYPNPFSTELTINELSTSSYIILFDMYGQTIYKGDQIIPAGILDELIEGTYLLRVYDESRSQLYQQVLMKIKE